MESEREKRSADITSGDGQGPCADARHLRLWLRAAEHDDAEAFGALYRLFWGRVVGFMARWDGKGAPLEDLAQEVFARAWQHRKDFRADARVETYLFAIARNTLNEYYRKRRREKAAARRVQEVHRDLLSYKPSSTHEGRLSTMVKAAVAKLPEKQRQAFELDQILELPREEAVRVANCTRSQFADRLYRAKKRLRRLLGHARPGAPV